MFVCLSLAGSRSRFKCGQFLKTNSQLQLLIMKLETTPSMIHASQTTPASPCPQAMEERCSQQRSCQASCIKVRARDIFHEASLVGMHATRYSRLSAVCNDWVYYVCAASYSILVRLGLHSCPGTIWLQGMYSV